MTTKSVLSNLKEIVNLSESMLAVAREGDWEQVRKIEQRRQSLFDQTFPLDNDAVADPVAVAQQIQKIADLDQETMSLMKESQKKLSGLAHKISSGRQAVSAYRDIQGR